MTDQYCFRIRYCEKRKILQFRCLYVYIDIGKALFLRSVTTHFWTRTLPFLCRERIIRQPINNGFLRCRKTKIRIRDTRKLNGNSIEIGTRIKRNVYFSYLTYKKIDRVFFFLFSSWFRRKQSIENRRNIFLAFRLCQRQKKRYSIDTLLKNIDRYTHGGYRNSYDSSRPAKSYGVHRELYSSDLLSHR